MRIRTHTVRHGETLATLAKLYYGDENLAGFIYLHNEQYVADINRIYPGQKLTIPHHAIEKNYCG